MGSTLDLLRRLTDEGVEFVLVGGMAAVAHGCSVVTEDVDVCVAFELGNLERVLRALRELNPRQRMQPHHPPISEHPASFVGWKNLYVVTDCGQLDFLGSVTGIGSYQDVSRGSVLLDLGGFQCRVMGLEDLIRAKKALGRPKDLRVAAELERVLQRRSKS